MTCESSGCFKFKELVVYVTFLIPSVLDLPVVGVFIIFLGVGLRWF